MGLFDRVNTRAVTWNRVYGDGSPGSRTSSGRRINEESALKYSVVWASVTLIADSLSTLQPEAFKEDPDTGVRTKIPVPAWILRPKGTYKRDEITNQLLISALLWGNGYAQFIRRDSDGFIVGLTVLDPATVEVEWDPGRPGFRRYRINGVGNPWLNETDIFHIQGATLPGAAKGLSVIAQARESIGLGLTLEEFGSRYFGQGSHQKVVIKVAKALKDAESRDLVRQYEMFTRGAENWHRPAVISGQNVDLENISIPPEDAQFLQSREHQAIDVARWFRVPPHRVGIISAETSWGSGLAEQNTAMVQTTFRPWINRLETTYTAYTPGGEDSGQKILLNVAELLRGSFKDMVDAWGAAVEQKIATPNEARKALGLDPIKGGDDIIKDPVPTPQSNGPTNQPDNGSTNNGPTNQRDEQLEKEIAELRKLQETIRHLPGRHNQQDHAGKGSVKHPTDKETKELHTRVQNEGGFTYRVADGHSPKSGFALSPYPERSGVIETKDFGSEHLTGYVDKNRDLLDKPDHYIGAWREQGDGIDRVWLDVSIVTPDRASAERIGKQHNQVAMFDLGSGTEIALGGTGAAD